MDTAFLESFVLVVEHGSVAEAARRLNLTPTAVMQRIRALEREIGSALVSRSGRTVHQTEAGAAVLDRARVLLRNVDDLRAAAAHRDFGGELSLGAISSVLTGILPDILSRLAVAHPRMRLHIHPGSSSSLYRKVDDGECDAAIIVEPYFELPKTCSWITWRVEPLVVLASRHLACDNPLQLLTSYPLIQYDKRQWGGKLAANYLQAKGLQLKPRYEVDSLDAIAVMVNRGLGVSVVPDWAPPWPEGLELRKLPLTDAPTRRVGLLWRRASTRICLVEVLIQQAAEALKGMELTLVSPKDKKMYLVKQYIPDSLFFAHSYNHGRSIVTAAQQKLSRDARRVVSKSNL